MTDLIIVGGGAAGMICAVEALRLGLKVLLIEKMDRIGKKVLATGNGRCNLANRNFDMSHYHGSCLPAAEAVFEEFPPERIEDFWKGLGILYREEERGRCYPRSLQASSVINVLRRTLSCYEQEGSLKVLTDTVVTGIRMDKKQKLYEITCRTREGEQVKTMQFKSPQAALLTGGKASPRLGSAGEGLEMAGKLKLPVTDLRPGICRLLSPDPMTKRLSGLRFDTRACLLSGKDRIAEARGELLFTDDGISGPCALDLSRQAGELLKEGKPAAIAADLAEEYPEGELFALLMERCELLKAVTLEEMLEGFLHKRIIPEVISQAGLDRKAAAGTMDKRKTGALCRVMKSFCVEISALDSFKDAQVTVGGVHQKALGQGLECAAYPGLYLGGELLDLDGDCGGYNLMFAAACGLSIASGAAAHQLEAEGGRG